MAEARRRPDLDPVDWLRDQLLHTVDRNQLCESVALDLNSHETLLSLYERKRKTFRGTHLGLDAFLNVRALGQDNTTSLHKARCLEPQMSKSDEAAFLDQSRKVFTARSHMDRIQIEGG